MEEKIIFISQEEIHSEKKGKDYYLIHYILNHKPKTDFVDEKTYNKISLKKLKELGEYTAVYNTSVVGISIIATLVDIK